MSAGPPCIMPLANADRHRRTHSLLLVSKLLSGRDNASPFTLIVDSLEQSAKPLVREITARAKAGRQAIVYVSFETHRSPGSVDVFVPAYDLSPTALQQALQKHVSSSTRTLIVIDSVNALAAGQSNLPGFFTALISPTTSLVATYHSDIPSRMSQSPYAPQDAAILHYLATTIMTTHSMSHLLQQKAARERSLASPVFGLQTEVEGVISSLGSNDRRGVVVEMEYRRKSGRGMHEWFFLPSASTGADLTKIPAQSKERFILLDDHPLFQAPKDQTGASDETVDTTFNLGLTEKQRIDRDGVVLPYFDAQKDGGVGEGGKILYDMGSEDDFDEEEDEI